MRLVLTFLISFVLVSLSEVTFPRLIATSSAYYNVGAGLALPNNKEELFLDVDALKPGMKGYGKTVFSGRNIEKFDIEVIGVLKNWEAKSDMILIKMFGAPLDKTGIIAGMSGSPVYVNDKMIGAVSYGWTFAKDAIAGVTPINEMLKVLHNIDTEGSANQQVVSRESNAHDTRLLNGNSVNLVPIRAPLMVSGFDGRVLERMQTELEKYGLFPVQGGGGVCTVPYGNEDTDNLEPGDAVAAVLVRGDLNASSIGTLTYREGNNIVAFGHPFFYTGATNLPMSSAYVYTVIANQSTSFKVAAATNVVGKISQDRKPGIGGTIGEYAQMIPCEVEVKGVQNAAYNFEIVHDKILSPSLVQWAVESALLATEKQAGPKMVKLSLSIQLDGRHKPVEIENSYYDVGAQWGPIYDITSPIGVLLNNPYEDVKINKISLSAYVFDAQRTAYIENISVSKRTVKPGDTIQIGVTLKPYNSPCIEKTISFQIPNDVVPGSIIALTACDAQYSQSLEKLRSPDIFKVRSFDQLVDLIESAEKRTNLIVRLRLSKRGITYQGQGFPSLPSSLLSIMAFSNHSGVGILYDEAVLRIETGWVLGGMQSLPLVVENG